MPEPLDPIRKVLSLDSVLDILETLPDAMLVSDGGGRIVAANAAAAALFGYRPDDLKGRPIEDLIPDRLRDAHTRRRAAYYNEPARRTMGTRPGLLALRGDGSEFPVDISLSRVVTTESEYFLSGVRDLSERLRTEELLRATAHNFQQLFEGANDIVYTHDLEGFFTAVNPAGLRVYGYSQEEALRLNVRDVLDAEHLERASEVVIRTLQGEEDGEPYELLTFAKDGTDVWVEVSTRIVMENGRPIGIQGIARDVTDRKRAERALREKERQLAGFVANAPVVFFAIDMEGLFTLYDGKGLFELGLRPGQLIGRSLYEVYATIPAIGDNARRALAGETFTSATEINGVHFEVHHSPIRDERGDVKGMLGIAVNATARIEAQEALRFSERRLKAVTSNVPIGLCAFDGHGTFTLFEGKALASFGRQAGEFVGRSAFEVFSRRPEIGDMIRDALAGREVTGLVELNGLAFELMLSPVEDGDGGVASVILVAVDVTERTEAEAALRSAMEFQDLVMQSTTDAIVAADLTGRITLVNRRTCEMTGYLPDELIGQPWRTIVAPEAIEKMREVLRGAVRHRLSAEGVEVEMLRRDGGRLQIAFNVAPLMEQGNTVGAVATAEDVTERKYAASLLSAQARLLELIAVGEPLDVVLDMLCSTVEELSRGALCSVLLTTEDGRRLRTGSAPSLPDEYNQAVDGLEVGPNAGSCGTAAFRREPVVVTDIASDPLWEGHRDRALHHGLRSCWSTPIFSSGGDVRGTFAVYYREVRGPEANDLALIRIATHVAGIAIERQRAEHAARSDTEELEGLYRKLVSANEELAESKERLEEKSHQLERALAQERERARRDQLTGALNHAAIAETLREVIAEQGSGPIAVAMVDVDGLKAANDTFGHQVGDAVLTTVARALGRAGAIVGRYGGDEFVAVIPGADRPAAEAYRQEVLASLAEARVADDQSGAAIPVVASIGVAIYPDEADAVDDLIKLSDSAMYASRRRRAVDGEGRAMAAALPGDRAARMVGEIVPLLTSPGDLSDKLRLVSHRLSVGAGYDTVNFVLLGAKQTSVTSSTIRGLSERDYEAWDSRATRPGHAITDVLRAGKRPLIIEDVSREEKLGPDERAMLARVGLRSALVAPMLWQNDMIGILSVASKRAAAFGPRDAEFVAAVATQVTAIVRMASMLDELQVSSGRLMRAHTETVLMLAGAAEAHDQTTGRHLQRVRGLTEALAADLGRSPDDARDLGLAAVLHDIGKIRVPDMVLGSSAKLAETEWVLMKQHTIWGSEFLAGQQGFELAVEVARSHHERWDGSGYPDGLVGEEIPESAQITAVADAFDAMTNDRPYRMGRPVADAVAEIVACAGTQFSPRVVDALVRLFERQALPFLQTDADDLEARAA